ncbi:MAG: hypothetical protein H6819_11940 [Phycisphaerales bacterium]|nr:hypothetical protein [Phycisphaerales bacterium]MCB9858060.1 hypothetical protein [Phycisphaerales bacterium]MCB9864157.1 hypothetical protein [Phycisphaerales bacterium]
MRNVRRQPCYVRTIGLALLLIGAMAAGCSFNEKRTNISPAFLRPMTVAVAPILNFSGEFQFDSSKAADLLASELTYVDGVTVLPVNRVIATLASQGKTQIESPEHALETASMVGADAIIVAGITEYDAYTPSVGFVLQMYTLNGSSMPDGFDAVGVSRMPRPVTTASYSDPHVPTSQVQLVLNGNHKEVRDLVREYAKPRENADIHLGWEQYLKVQTLYLRFCWHEAIDRLMDQERARRLHLAAEADAMEVPA